jgi:hypothetical protein
MSKKHTLPVIGNANGFQYVTSGLPEFVGPDIAPSSVIDQPAYPRIMIVSAAGAVGKSTLANEIAYRTKAPIWNLALASAVGANSATGQLTASFGFSLAGTISAKLVAGELFLIIDALDEARVKANEAGFEAFVQNIAVIANAASKTVIVLLARTQTAETTWLILGSAGVEASLYSIQPFTRDQAEAYIEARIRHLDDSAAKRISDHPQPFVEARDLILDQLELAVGGAVQVKDEASREFLGYAPVLETVAFLLAKESNFQEFTANLKSIAQSSERQATRPLAVLEHVVKRLLDREQKQKLQANIKPALEKAAAETGWNDWDKLYLPDEQIWRLIAKILDCKVDACPEMPAAVRARYEEQLIAWLPEHPFLREGTQPANKVFESYLFAIAMREYLTPTSNLVEQRIAARQYKPSRLLADFYILLGQQRGEEVIAERQIGLLYDSLLAGENDAFKVRLSVESGDPDEEEDKESTSEGEFELVYSTPGEDGDERVETRNFKIVEGAGALCFGRQLKDAAIVTQGKVVLGGAADDFEIGPAVDIRCGLIEIASTGFVVRGVPKPKDSDAVVIEAKRCQSVVSQKPLVRGSLSVSWPHAQSFPWNDYAASSQISEIDTDEVQKVYHRFRRIVLSLRSHSKGSLARFKDKIEHRRVLKNPMGKALLEKLCHDGILKLKDEFYHWVPDRADAILKVSWQGLRNRQVTSAMKDYFCGFINANSQYF